MKGLQLKDFLIKPVQRIWCALPLSPLHSRPSKYPLLFKNLLELTPEGDPEHANIAQCYQLMEGVNTHVPRHVLSMLTKQKSSKASMRPRTRV